MAAIILGIVEGITEFLPVSSTGHMLLAEHFLNRPQPDVFIAVVQCGAVLAVGLVFAKRIRGFVTEWEDPATRRYVAQLAAAFVLTAIGGLILKKGGFKLPKDPAPIAWATAVGGVLIIAVEKWLDERRATSKIKWSVALAIGVAQLIAVVFPGSSRSGTTILMALAVGVKRSAAAEFSFLLGIPTLLSAGAVEILGAVRHPGPVPVDWGVVALGTIVASAVAFASVKWMLYYIRNHNFIPFGWYRIGIGVLILVAFSPLRR